MKEIKKILKFIWSAIMTLSNKLSTTYLKMIPKVPQPDQNTILSAKIPTVSVRMTGVDLTVVQSFKIC